MIALIDTILGPFIMWLTKLQSSLGNLILPKGHTINFGNVFAPIAMISPAWQFLITNVFLMVFIYTIVFINVNGQGMLKSFKESIKWW